MEKTLERWARFYVYKYCIDHKMRCQNAYTLHGFDCCSFLKLIELDNILAIHSSGTDLDSAFCIYTKYTKNKQSHTKHRKRPEYNGQNTKSEQKTRVSLCKSVRSFYPL